MAADDRRRLLPRQVPDPDGAVEAAGHEPATVRTEGHVGSRAVVLAEHARAARAAPHLHGAVSAGAGDGVVNRAEPDVVRAPWLATDLLRLRARREVEDVNAAARERDG